MEDVSNRSLVKEIIDFLFDPDTGCCTNARLLANGIEGIVARANYGPGGRTQQDIWNIVWDKPFYSHIKASIATKAVNHARAYFVANLRDIQSAGWQIIRNTTAPQKHEYIYAGNLALQATTTGIASLLTGPLMHPCRGERLWRVRELALALPKNIVAADNDYTRWLDINGIAASRHTIGWSKINRNGARDAGSPFISAIDAVPGFAYTTACHIAADLGYPVYKMDTWVRAAVAALPEVHNLLETKLGGAALPSGLLSPDRKMGQALMLKVLDELVDDFVEPMPELSTVDLSTVDLDYGFNRLRVADFVIAHIGMNPEPEFGLKNTPLKVLPGNSALSARYPKLSEIASNMSRLDYGDKSVPAGLDGAITSLLSGQNTVLKSGRSLR